MISTRFINYFLAFAAIILGANVPAFSAGSELWRQISDESPAMREQRSVSPEKYLIFRINQAALRKSLNVLPLENTEAARTNPLVMEVPMPDGSFQKFRMEKTQGLSPELQAEFPDWKSFVGYGVDDPTLTGRFDWNVNGFHGYVSTKQGVVMIDPYQKGATQNYLVFYKHDFGAPTDEFYCRFEESVKKIVSSNYETNFLPDAPAFSFGTTVRTYRIAIATTGEWARNAAGYNGTQTPLQIRTAALGVIDTTRNRLSGIYLRELASQFQLVNPPVSNDAANIIFDDPATDPYDNTDTSAQLTINHSTITNRVGTPNFDIGHLYGTGGGGVAQSPSLCDDGDKGQGYSARGTQTGDPFTVDYVAHEIGHQFGSNHTYNNIDTPGTGACPQSSYSAANAFEPGSGSTIMSYVGICGARNLQQYVDTGLPAFHIRSQTVISNYIATVAGCGTATGTNSIPTVNAGAAYTIPGLTPFALTAVGADADAGDAGNLLYSWEEYDLAQQPSGPLGIPANTYDVDTDGVLRPLFRVYSPISSSQRTFPSLNFILNPAGNDPAGSNQPALTYTGTHPTNAPGAVCETGMTCVVGERLPTVNRTMNFRVSVRDRRGGVADAGTTVTVNASAGPFVVNTQNTATGWQGNSVQTITWNVANTNAAPVNTANVNIRLSTDGGQTFPIMLSPNTPNDGTEAITIPNIATTTARIKIEAVGNVFFDINNVNFAINTATTTRAPFDFDGDGRTDVAVFRPSNGNWYLNRSAAGFSAVQFGAAEDLIAPADYDGDGKTDIGVFRPSNGTWYRINSQNNTFAGVQFGQAGDKPLPADYDGDGKADVNVFRPSNGTWYRLNSNGNQFVANPFGQSGDVPVIGDFDGNGRADLAVFRPSANQWYVAKATGVPAQNFDTYNFGAADDIPVPANYDGDTKTDIAVFRPSTGVWYRINSSTNQVAAVTFGQNGDVPIAGDYDGDSKADVSVFRPANGAWYSQNSQTGFLVTMFGANSDKPVPSAFNR